MASLGNLNDTTVANYARVVCAINLQRLAEILNDDKIWAFSLANDASTHYGMSYFDNRIHFHRDGIFYNIHALAIPMFEQHTGEKMSNLVFDFLDIVCPDWRAKLIGVSTDGASVMTGSVKGVATRIEKEAKYNIYRIWCGLHQLDLVMKYAYQDLQCPDGKFNKIMHLFTGYLRRQQILINDMQSICPKATTRWTAMGGICNWLLVRRVSLLKYIAKDDPTKAPPSWWWVVVAGINALAEQVNIVFIKLQAKDLLLSQQATAFDELAVVICRQIDIDGPYTADQIAAIDKTTNYTFSRWSISNQNIINYIYDQGTFIEDTYNQLPIQSQIEIIHMIGLLIMHIVDGVLNIQAERDSINLSVNNLPSVLPHELIKIPGREFTKIISMHINHLRHIWSEELIDKLELQHRQFLIAYQHESSLKSAFNGCDGNTSFEYGWSIIEGAKRFDVLMDFCGGIATIFPNTATVESDFSVLGWEKDEYRKSLTDLSLEGIMQCKQFDLMSSLVG